MNTKLNPALRPNWSPKVMAGSLGLAAVLVGNAFATGPYPPTDWPPTIDASKQVHYCVFDGAFASPNANWTNSLSLVQGGDQSWVVAGCLDGFTGSKGANTYLNIRDTNWTYWASVDQIDVLMQVHGDTGLLYGGTDTNRTRVLKFQEGSSSPTTYTPAGYSKAAYNGRWNWILWSMTNGWFTNNGVGYHLVGNLKSGSTSPFGGVNNGTIRLVSQDGNFIGFTIHAIAIGPAGAFGTTNDMNQFDVPVVVPDCPVPAANLVGLDFNVGLTNNLVIVSNVDAQLQVQSGIGPAGDQRTAVLPLAAGGGGWLYNFGITTNDQGVPYLGYPCKNVIVKICADFYDDPAFADWPGMVKFGPEAYATDPLGCSVMVYPDANLHVLSGSGQWIRRSWIISNVNLHGVNTSPLTGGPRLISKMYPVAVSRVEMAILRTGSDPLAGLDPLAGCAQDPMVCAGAYTNYVELDVANSVKNGLDLGNATSSQAWLTEMAGPTGDQRNSVCPDTNVGPYLQFQILNTALGPNYQDNAHLAIVATYYDDPALKGKTFGIDAWNYQLYGADTIYAASSTKRITLEGTDKWRDAYWEIDRLNFKGVNMTGQQAGPRFQCDAGAKIHLSRVRYAIIRACGPNTGLNLLDSYRVTTLNIGADTNGVLRLSWPYREPQLTVQGATDLGGGWSLFQDVPILPQAEQAVVPLSPTNGNQFFRLFRPSLP